MYSTFWSRDGGRSANLHANHTTQSAGAVHLKPWLVSGNAGIYPRQER